MTQNANPGPCLLCVDMQPVFVNTVPDKERLMSRCAFAIEAAQGLGLGVLFTEQVPQKLGSTDASLLALVPTPVQAGKATFSVLADHGLRELVTQKMGADHLILIGIETPICVYQTAIDAINAGIPVTLLSDCIGGRRTQDCADALDALKRAGAHVLPSETLFYSILGDTHHPFFKEYTKLVKKYA